MGTAPFMPFNVEVEKRKTKEKTNKQTYLKWTCTIFMCQISFIIFLSWVLVHVWGSCTISVVHGSLRQHTCKLLQWRYGLSQQAFSTQGKIETLIFFSSFRKITKFCQNSETTLFGLEGVCQQICKRLKMGEKMAREIEDIHDVFWQVRKIAMDEQKHSRWLDIQQKNYEIKTKYATSYL